ncbi:MAG TPA: class E sortase [Streptosporangiaceae bacterium]|nr:class E sortase [Streptosporangiaceae bacterium]
MTANDLQRSTGGEAANTPLVVNERAKAPRAAQPRARRIYTRRMLPVSPARAVVIATTATIAVLGLWFVLYALVLSGLRENHAQHLMGSQLRQGLAEQTVPYGGVIKPGTPIGRIIAPQIGLDAVVVEGTSSEQLASGPGHLPSTPMPGQAGNAQIFGRSAMYGAPFGLVHALKPGAMITLVTGDGVFRFQVIDVRWPGYQIPSAAQLGQSSLTLVTSAASGWRAGWAPNYVIYADATLVGGKVQPATRQPTAVPAADAPLAGDTGQLVLLPYLVLGLLALCAGLGWASARWTMWQLWAVGVPSVVAMLWLTTNSVLLLLPNLT